ncbi:MAG: hypothetical protein R3C20_13570 [Planctomycetaceae bacterium]
MRRRAAANTSPGACISEGLEDRLLLTAYVVDTVDDSALVADGMLSLREAITAANTNLPYLDAAAGEVGPGVVDTITFAASLSGQTITLNGTSLLILDDLSISDSNGSPITIDAADASRIFEIGTGTGSVSAAISNVMITGGQEIRGGGIFVGSGESLVLDSVTITGNSAIGPIGSDGGGGVYNDGGTLTISNSVVSDNLATGVSGSGGGLFSAGGSAIIMNSIFQGNSANRAGGGIEVLNGDVSILDSDLSGNDVSGGAGTANPGNGGGLHITGGGMVTITGGTVNGNTAANEGGGLWNHAASTLTVSR